MKYRGKYSLAENLFRGRGMGLLMEGGSTVWGSGWASEVTVTKAYGGTLKPNHMNGSHSGSGDKQDANIGAGDNEVKEQMLTLGDFTASPGTTLMPLEIQARRAGELHPGSLSAQLRRYCKKNLGGIVDWKPSIGSNIDDRSSIPGKDTATEDELADIGEEMAQFLSSEFYCCVFKGENIDIYAPDMSGATALGVAPYFGNQSRPIVVFEIPLGSPAKTETRTAVRDFLKQGGVDMTKIKKKSPLYAPPAAPAAGATP